MHIYGEREEGKKKREKKSGKKEDRERRKMHMWRTRERKREEENIYEKNIYKTLNKKDKKGNAGSEDTKIELYE